MVLPPHRVSTLMFSSPARQAADFARHLVGQLPRRTQHQRLHREAARIQAGQQAQGKGRGLAAAGLGLRDQVLAGEGRRQAGGLDRGHLQVAQLAQVRQRGRRQRQSVEGEGRCAGVSRVHGGRGNGGRCWSGVGHARL
jgi:hypothetical protein